MKTLEAEKLGPVSVLGIKEAVQFGGSMEIEKGLDIKKKHTYATGGLKDTVRIFEHYFQAMESGVGESELINSYMRVGIVDFDGR